MATKKRCNATFAQKRLDDAIRGRDQAIAQFIEADGQKTRKAIQDSTKAVVDDAHKTRDDMNKRLDSLENKADTLIQLATGQAIHNPTLTSSQIMEANRQAVVKIQGQNRGIREAKAKDREDGTNLVDTLKFLRLQDRKERHEAKAKEKEKEALEDQELLEDLVEPEAQNTEKEEETAKKEKDDKKETKEKKAEMDRANAPAEAQAQARANQKKRTLEGQWRPEVEKELQADADALEFARRVSAGLSVGSSPPAAALQQQAAAEVSLQASGPRKKRRRLASTEEISFDRFYKANNQQRIDLVVKAYIYAAFSSTNPVPTFGKPNEWLEEKYQSLHAQAIAIAKQNGVAFADSETVDVPPPADAVHPQDPVLPSSKPAAPLNEPPAKKARVAKQVLTSGGGKGKEVVAAVGIAKSMGIAFIKDEVPMHD